MTRTEVMKGTFNRVFMGRPEHIVQIWPGSFGKSLLDEPTTAKAKLAWAKDPAPSPQAGNGPRRASPSRRLHCAIGPKRVGCP
jgi:hypothetical protein